MTDKHKSPGKSSGKVPETRAAGTDAGQEPVPMVRQPISRLVDVSELDVTGMPIELDLTADECATLAKAYDLPAVHAVSVRGTAWPAEDGVFVEFRLHADIVQECVVTLDHFDSVVDETVRLHYTPQAASPAGSGVVDVTDEDDPPEPMTDEKIDIGAAAAEHLALVLDPFPKRPGAELPAVAAEPELKRPSPFAVLAQLKKD